MARGTLFEHLDRTPVTYLVLMVYITLAFLTDPIDPDARALINHGAAFGALIADGEPWRLLTYAFVHGGLLHLLLNGYSLMQMGPIVEASLGSVRFAVLYAVTAVAGAVTASIWNDDLAAPLVGGSGALFGMFGAMVAMNMRGGRHLLEFLEFRGPRSIVTVIAMNLVICFFLPMVSNSAHVGGLIAGFVLVFVFFDLGRHAKVDAITRAIQAGWIALLVSAVVYCTRPVGNDFYNSPLFAPQVTQWRHELRSGE